MLMSEFPVVSVHIPPMLRTLSGGHEEVMASGETVGDILRAIGHSYPDLGARILCGDGHLADGLCVYVGGCALPDGMLTPVAPEEVLSLVATGEISCEIPAAVANKSKVPDEAVISIGV